MSKANEYNITIKTEDGIRFVFDHIRKKWLKLTPEEKVRQVFLKYLVEQKKYPLGLIATEMGLKINGHSKRADIVVYKQARPYIIIECKADTQKLTQATIEQAANYNINLQVPYLAITNGKKAIFVRIFHQEHRWEQVPELPSFSY